MDHLRALFGAFCPDPDDVEARAMLALSLVIGVVDPIPACRADENSPAAASRSP